ncbi:MAG: SusC/RagA family TonB-linked outer membrane protein [Bacteroidaceae bacterium]|nr:SusC/RagA family TonB-linked outer membrane protein [Bacteroidaceae bacterium]
MAALPGLLQAQKAGDIISGVIEDAEGPMMMVNVTERDAADRIVAHAITDMEGNFSFRLVNPSDRLQVTYVGYETVDIPINKTYFEITMKDAGEIPQVDIVAERVSETTGLPIPLREQGAVVQTIDMTDFESLGITTVDEALQGQVAGLDIVFDSGDLGARSTMRLRGQSTLTGDGNPLIVIDGNILSIDDNTENMVVDKINEMGGILAGNSPEQDRLAELLSINPSDIASISFLKDAAATAIWGMRGANGVMEIKTKRGQRGATRVNYSYRLNANFQPEGYKYLNGDQYTMFVKESLFNPHLDDALTNSIWEINYVQTKPDYEMWNDNTDWVGAVKKVGISQSHNFSVSGGGDKANFRISAGFDDETGSVVGQKMNRFTTRVNFDYFVSERIKVSTNFSMSYSNNRRSGNTAISSAQEMMPNLAIYYEDPLTGEPTGEYYLMPSSSSSDLPKQSNPLLEAAEKESYSISMNVNPDFHLTYNLLGLDNSQTRLTYEGQIQFGVSNSSSENYTPQSLSRDGWSDQNANSTSNSSSKNSSINTQHSLTFQPHLKNRNHSIMAMARLTVQNSNGKNMSTGVGGLPSGPFKSPGLPGRITSMSTGASRNRSVGVTTQVHYSYKSKYSLTFTTRSDGTTRTGNAKKWGTFPAASARWNISDEKFFDNIRNSGLITMAGFNVSWGFTGNAPGGDDMFRSRYSTGSSYMGVTTIYPANIRLSDFQWEESTQWNFGLNLGMFKDKFNASINFYHTTNDKLINSNYPIPSSSGFTSLGAVNDGKMMNEGWDMSISANRIYSTKLFGKDFSVGGNVNFGDNTNQVLEMNDIILKSWQQDFDMSNPHTKYLSYVALKNSYGSIYGFKYKGIYQYSDYSEVEVPGVSGPNAPVVKDADGNVILNSKGKTKPMMFGYGTLSTPYEFVGGDVAYEDINHDGNINELDIVYLGSSLPKLNGGFSLRMSWGRWSWNNNFNFRYGNRIVNMSRLGAEAPRELRNVMAAINWRWRVEGDVTEVPRTLYKWGYNDLGSDRYVEDGSFLRWTSTSLNYSLDPKFTKKIHLSGVSFNFNLNNLATWTKYTGLDPEVSSGRGQVASDNSRTPRARRITFGVNVNF